jgi:hypothetical protein
VWFSNDLVPDDLISPVIMNPSEDRHTGAGLLDPTRGLTLNKVHRKKSPANHSFTRKMAYFNHTLRAQ